MNTSEEIAYEAGLAIARKIDMDLTLTFFGGEKLLEDYTEDEVMAALNGMLRNYRENTERYLSHMRFWKWHKSIIDDCVVASRCRYYGSR